STRRVRACSALCCRTCFWLDSTGELVDATCHTGVPASNPRTYTRSKHCALLEDYGEGCFSTLPRQLPPDPLTSRDRSRLDKTISTFSSELYQKLGEKSAIDPAAPRTTAQ